MDREALVHMCCAEHAALFQKFAEAILQMLDNYKVQATYYPPSISSVRERVYKRD